MNTRKITIKTTPRALQLLRLVAAHTGEHQYEVLERLLQHELDRVERARRCIALEEQGGTDEA